MQVVTEEELINDEDYEDIMEDMKIECGKFGKGVKELKTASMRLVSQFAQSQTSAGYFKNALLWMPSPRRQKLQVVIFLYYSTSLWDFIRVTILAFFGSLEVFLESLMYADDVTFAEVSLCSKDLQVYSWSMGHVSVYAEQRCLLAQCMLKVYVEIAKSPKCIIVLLTHGLLACNMICCMAFGTSELNGFTKGVWNRFNTMSRLENLSDNWTDAISGVSIRLANSDNGGYLYFYMDCLGNGVPWVISCIVVLLS
ncbi:hypothetical protein Tco_1023936 [Tanacetum coccineum]